MFKWLKKATKGKDSNFWFGKNSLWAETGLGGSVGKGVEDGLTGVFDNGLKTQNTFELGTQEKVIIGVVLFSFLYLK
jgi:hypothetical protein